MTTDRQRAVIREAVKAALGEAFRIDAYRDEVTASLPFSVPAGRYSVAHERYATAVVHRDLDGRKSVTATDVRSIRDDLIAGFRRGATDPRYTEQARVDYHRALSILRDTGRIE